LIAAWDDKQNLMNLRDAPIKQKLTAAIMLTSTAVLLLTAAVYIVHEVITFRQTLAENCKTIARITAAQSSGAVDYQNEPDCRKILSKLNSESPVLLAALYASPGKMLARYPESAGVSSFPAVPVIGEYLIEHGAVNIVVPVRQDDRVVGALYLKWDLSPAYRRFRWDAAVLALMLIGSLGVALAISNALQRRISGPILELAETARAVSVNHDYSVRAKKYGNDELGLLTEALNQMLTRIGEQNEALRKNQEQLRLALQSAQAAAGEVRALNADLEDRVTRRTAELAASNQELEAFTYSVSHDLRAPLRHLDSFSQLLESEILINPAGARQYAARIRLVTQNMSRLVDDMLSLSRLGQASLQRQTVRLNAVVDEVLAELKPEVKNRHIEWRVAELPSAAVDPGLIKQVFANLISNAIKYTRPRAEAVIEIGAEPAGGTTAVFIRDNGVGFSMMDARKLFRVFQRLHRPEDFEGNGIGLATVQRIIQLHGGKIWFQAELDKGATFHFTLQGIGAAGPANSQ
jgi:signal transduction histidine kinase